MSVSAPPSEAAAPEPSTRLPGSRSAWILAVCCVAQFMVILDLSIVNVALPSIQTSLEFSSPDLQWVVDAYSITFAGFLLFGGRASDHFGQRRTFVLAFAVFAAASLVGGVASSQAMLVAARGVQGLGGALMAASSLAIITSTFQGPKLHRAIATWAAMNGLGGSAGVLFGGIITQYLSWRWVLLINPPIGVIATLVAYRVVTERVRAKEGESFDLAGALTLTAGQMVLVFGVVEAGLRGWSSAPALGPIIAGIVILGVFGVIETRTRNPLIPFKELTPALQLANNIVLLFSATIFPMWLVSSLYLQQVLGLSPFHTGLVFLPMTIVIALIATRAGKLVSRFGVKPVLGGGLMMLTASLFLLARIGSSGNGFVYIAVPGLLAAAGIAMSIVPSTIAATQGAKPGQAGLASGLVNTSRQVGGGLGLAILLILATQHSSQLIGSGHNVNSSLTAGFRLAFIIGGGLAAAALLLTLFALPGPDEKLRSMGRRVTAAFAVIVAVFVALDVAFANSHGAPIGAYVTSPQTTYSYVTEPSLHPPKIRFIGEPAPSRKLAPGYIFMTNFYNVSYPPMVGQSGPMILDQKLQPVWFHPVPSKVVASNLTLESYQGKPALAWWQGVVTNTGATDSGEWIVDDEHYHTLARIKGKDGWILTLHELLIEGEDAWVSANKNVAYNLSKYGGAYNGALIDSAVLEYDLHTGKLIRVWDALKHINPSQSYATVPTNGFPWDAYHINSISLSGKGTFLVSMRDTWAAYMVNIATGKIEWTLGGRKSSFSFGPEAAFQWQHDVKLGPGSEVTLFDDHCCQLTGGGTYVPPSGPSRGLVLNLDQKTHKATLVAQYGQEEFLDPDYMGDIEPLPNKNVFVGWGDEPYLSEFNHSGELLMEAEFPRPDLSYRATLGPWVGEPTYPPTGAARAHSGKTVVYASWNGDTQVASWRVLAASGTGALTSVGQAAKSGFQTAIPVPGEPQSFEVQALDAAGHVIGTSSEFALGKRS